MNKGRYLLLALATFFIAIIHISISNTLTEIPLIIFPLLFIIFLFYYVPTPQAYFFAMLNGLFLDIFSVLPFGTYILLSALIISLLLLLTHTIFSKQTTISKAVLTAFMTFCYFMLLRTVEHIQLSVFNSVPHELIPSSLIGTLVLLLLIQTIIIVSLSIFLGRRRLYNLKPHISI